MRRVKLVLLTEDIAACAFRVFGGKTAKLAVSVQKEK